MTTAGTVAATVLCCLPFATGVIGATIAAVGAQFAPVRPCLVVVSVSLLAYAFYNTYRDAPAPCAEGACPPSSGRRPRRVAVWIVAIVVGLLLSASWWLNWIIYWTL